MPTDSIQSIKTRNPLHVFVVFALGIVLPGGFLSYLGFRSMHYESLLIQKQAEEHYAALADLTQRKAEEQLAELVKALTSLAGSDTFQQGTVPDLIPAVLAVSRLNDLPLQNLFVFDDLDQMSVPPSYEHVVEKPQDVEWGVLRDDIERLEHLEFIDKDIGQAVEGYKHLLTRTSQAPLRAQLLKNIAGGYRKLHQTGQAETQYQELIRNYDHLVDPSGYPTGILGRQLLIKLYEDGKFLDRATQTRLDLMEGLILDRWALSAAQREALWQSLRLSMPKGPPGSGETRGRWERLTALQSRLERLRPYAQVFMRQEWPDVLKRLRMHGWLDQGGVLQLAGEPSHPPIVVVAPIFSPSSGRRRGLLVAVLSAETFWPVVDRSLTELAKPVGLELHWEHSTQPPGSVGSGLWKAVLDRQVSSIDPPLHLQLSAPHAQQEDVLSRRRLWIYSGMVGLSCIVIIVGLFVMRQAVKRETEIANLKADFVANVSHELRTPLATISYIGERLSLGRYRSETEKNEFYGMLGEETHRLKDLIEDILDFSKMLAGKKVYRQDPLDLSAVIWEACDRFKGKAQAQGFEVALQPMDEAVAIEGDRKALLQALLNLLDNALKYSGASRRIDIRMEQNHQRVGVMIQDYGIGIPPTEQEKIFEKFYRVERSLSRESEGGVGLGLAMVKHIIEGHRGHIQLKSHLGEGSAFWLWFPLRQGGHHGTHPGR